MTQPDIPIRASTVGEALAQARRAGRVASNIAQAILAHILECDRAWVLAHTESALTPQQATRLAELLSRAAQGEPLAPPAARFCQRLSHLIGYPRPETEGLVGGAQLEQAPRANDSSSGRWARRHCIISRPAATGISAADVSRGSTLPP
jgi:release factor glutamine methyltransferase